MIDHLLKPRVFVAMPFGRKQNEDGDTVNFDRVYEELFFPALSPEFSGFRADYDKRAGNIATDMFQDLLLADIVLVDISIDNPNAWYELGVRHTLRARGVVMVQGTGRRIPFDIVQERVFPYTLAMDGDDLVPDPDCAEEDRAMIADRVRRVVDGWDGRVDSPVYDRLPALREPD